MPRTDNVQIRIDFITDESKEFARTIKDTERFRTELKKAQKDVETLTKEQQTLAAQGKDTTAVALRLAEAERRVEQSLQGIAQSSRDIAKIDLSKLMPSQLVTRANQLRQALQFIPAGHPERAQMEADLRRINSQLADMNGRTRGVSTEMANLRGGGGFSSMLEGATKFAGWIGAAIVAVKALWETISVGVGKAAEIEQTGVAFEVLAGGAQNAQALTKALFEFAAKTPFELPQVNDAARKLLAYGYAAKDIVPTLQKIGDVAAAVGIPIDELASIFGKAKLGEFIQAEELNQLADRGIPVFESLAKQLGVSTSEVKKMGSEGKIHFKNLEVAFNELAGAGGRFNGMMDKQSGTFNGLMSTLKDNTSQLLATVFKPVMEGLKPILTYIIDSIGSLTLQIKLFYVFSAATWAGFQAGVGAAVDNAVNMFERLKMSVQIAGSEVAKALSFDEKVKAAHQNTLNQMYAQRDKLSQAGKSVGGAFSEAFKNSVNQASADAKFADDAAKKAANAAKGDPKDAEKAEKDRLARVKKALELELDARDIAFRKEALVNEIAFLNKEKNESDFNKKLLQLESEKYDAQIKIFDTYQSAFGAKSKEFQDLEIKKLEAQKKLIETNAQLRPRSSEEVQTLGTRQSTGVQSDVNDPIARIQANAEVEKSLIQQKFGDILRFEQEFEIKRLEIQSQAFAAQLAVLKANGAEETAEYKRIGKEKEAVDKELTDNKIRLAEIEKNIEQAKGQIAQDVFAVGIELLSADQEARKKHASAIKAFQIGQIVTSGILEVQKIWATVAEYGPAGPIIGAILTAITVARSAAAIGRVGSQKFAFGGIAKTGIFGGNSHSAGGTKGMFEDGTAVEVEKDEAFVVVNKKNTPLLSALSFINSANGNGKSFYGEQGFALNLNTTPRFSTGVTPQYNGSADMSKLESKLDAYLSKMDNWATSFEVNLPLTKLEGKQREISLDRTEASY